MGGNKKAINTLIIMQNGNGKNQKNQVNKNEAGGTQKAFSLIKGNHKLFLSCMNKS